MNVLSRLRVALITTVMLLGLATSASAECAWILWAVDQSMTDWKPISAYSGGARTGSAEGDCIYDAKTLPPIPRHSLMCLPDTIDPRGPKGSKP